jgi:excisionase family DNA binding protein
MGTSTCHSAPVQQTVVTAGAGQPQSRHRATNRQGKSPAEVAAYFGVKVDKVLFWIHAGELRAINTALKPNGRPRYRILEKDLEDFERHRANHPAPEKKRQPSPGLSRLLGVKEYYR